MTIVSINTVLYRLVSVCFSTTVLQILIHFGNHCGFITDITFYMMILFVISILHISGDYFVHSKELTGIVETDKGPVQGEILKTVRRSMEFSSFRGIRYGKAPIGYSRFGPPEEAEPWSDLLDATSEGNPCPQIDPVQSAIFVDEDCLNLNVYSPWINFNDTKKNLLPVIVWIYGGGFRFGNTNMKMYGPDYLIENQVVVVIMNYRLGVLGFLSLNLPGATGNAGLKDQQLALKWIQKNIKRFGGDPSSVTIAGNSAGATAVDYHALADGSQGLFDRSISMSASPLCTWGFSLASEAEERAFHLGSILGINATNKVQLLEAFYNQSVYDLVMASQQLTLIDPPFKPTVEDSIVAGDTAFLTECSVKKYKSGNFSQMPYIVGFMRDEALSFLENLAQAQDQIQLAINQMEQLSHDNPVNTILHSYDIILNTISSLDDLDNATFQNLVTILSDVEFISGIDMKQQLLARYGAGPVYYYRNSFAPYPSVHRFLDGVNQDGAGHSDDVPFVWYMSIADFPTDPEHPFVIMQDQISRMFTNFAKYSNPTPLGKRDLLLNITWPISGLESVYLEIDDEFSVGKYPIDQFTKLIEEISKPALGKVNGC